MRILYVTNSLDVGGAETSLVRLAGAMHQRGHEIAVLSSGGALESDLARSGARHHKAPVGLDPSKALRAALRLRAVVRAFRPDVVHSLSAAANLATQLLPRGRNAPLIVSSPMGLKNSDTESGIVTTLRNVLVALRTDGLLVISEEIDRAMRLIPLAGQQIVRCNVNGIDLARFARQDPASLADLRAELGLLEDGQVVTTIGALHSRKSHRLFIDAAVEVRRALPRTIFLLVGDGPERGRLLSHVSQRGLHDVLVFTGARSDVPRLLGITDVYVKPGIVEGFVGLTVLEAMAAGVPVVAFDTKDVRAAVEDSVTGLIVPRGDARALAAAIVVLLNDPQAAHALATRGRRLVERRYEIGSVAANVERTYVDLLRARAADGS